MKLLLALLAGAAAGYYAAFWVMTRPEQPPVVPFRDLMEPDFA